MGTMSEDEMRRRLGMGPDPTYDLLQWRLAYALSPKEHEPVMLNMGDHEIPLTVGIALDWAERLADEWLR